MGLSQKVGINSRFFCGVKLMDLGSRVKELVGEILKQHQDIELVDLMIKPQNGFYQIIVLIDTPKGVLLADCVKINKQIGYKLEEQNIFKSKYKVEVCSPGMDRILKTAADFKRVCGKKLEIAILEPISNKLFLSGILKQVIDDKIVLNISEDNDVQVNLDNIKQARLEIRW